MANHDYVIDNQSAPSARSDINNALAAIVTNNSGASAPSVTYAGMWWLDTTNNYLKLRDKDNAGWVIVGELDVVNDRWEIVSNSLKAASASGIDVYNSAGTKIIDLQIASEATAKAGTNNTELMTPLRVRQAAATPTGVIMPFAGTSAPSDWLFCYGQPLSTSTYGDLFAVIGYTYGGSGSTFYVPDLRGRTIAGQDDMGGTSANRLTNQSGGLDGDTLGATGGSETHTLTEAQLAAHEHFVFNGDTNYTNTPGVSSTNSPAANNTLYAGNNGYIMTGSATTPDRGISSTTGSDAAHNNVQPTIILNYIIKI